MIEKRESKVKGFVFKTKEGRATATVYVDLDHVFERFVLRLEDSTTIDILDPEDVGKAHLKFRIDIAFVCVALLHCFSREKSLKTYCSIHALRDHILLNLARFNRLYQKLACKAEDSLVYGLNTVEFDELKKEKEE